MFGSKKNPDARSPEDARIHKQFHFESSREALRAAFLANGAALLAMLSFLGRANAEPLSAGGRCLVAAGVFGFGLGLLLAIIATLTMWAHQEEVDLNIRDQSKSPPKWRHSNRTIRIWLWASLAGLFTGFTCSAISILFVP